MRLSKRQLLVGFVATVTATTGLVVGPSGVVAVARPATATRTSPSTATAASGQAVTLVTGDTVLQRSTGSRTTYAVRPARRTGAGAAMRTLHVGDHAYVMPLVAEAFLGRLLDPSLFDVTALAAAPATARLDVTIAHTGARPSLPGVTVTADAGGVASGYLTTRSARRFGAALVRKWSADHGRGSGEDRGVFDGIRRISARTAAPPVAHPMFPMHTLVIRGIDSHGKPMDFGGGLLMNVDDGRKYTGFINIENGEARVSVPTGHYSGAFDWFGVSSSGRFEVRTMPVAQYTVRGDGQTLTVDARRATTRPRVHTPRPVVTGDATFTYTRTDARGTGSISFADGVDTAIDYRIAATPRVRIGTQSFGTTYRLAAPGRTPRYTYDLSFGAHRVARRLVHRVRARQVATARSRYDADRPRRLAVFGRYPIDPQESFFFVSLYELRVPSRRTEYVYGQGVPTWGEIELGNVMAADPDELDGVQSYPAGAVRSRVWHHGPLGAGIPTYPAHSPYPFCYACRAGSTLSVGLAAFTDSTPDHTGYLYGSADGTPVAHFRLSRGGTVLADEDDALGAAVTVPGARGRYHATLDVDRSWTGTTKSTTSHTELAFSSARGSGRRAPGGWACESESAQPCRVLPVLQARAHLPMSARGTLPSGRSTVAVVARRVQGASRAAVTGATLALRPSGLPWRRVPLRPAGHGRYRADVDLSRRLAGRTVDVRVSARDAGGSTFRQTVTRAFAVAGARPTGRAVHRACGQAAPGHVSCLAQWRSGAGAGRTARVSGKQASTSSPDQGYGPADIASAYRLDTSKGAGQTVAIVDAYDDPKVEADLTAFRKAWGLPACTTANGCFRKVNQRGGTKPPPRDAGWGVEISLDVQAVSTACPRCRILLVEADSDFFDDIGAAVDRAVAMGAKIVSNSYGGDEFGSSATLGRAYYSHPQVAMVASSGDYGFTTAQFPAVWRSVIAVGGTTLRHSGTSWRQRAWSGAGSGCSAYFAKPAWQTDRHCSMRTTSDVSAVADPETGLAVYDTFGLGPDNGWIVVGGTSLSAPLVSGMIGLAGNAAQLGSARYIYEHRSALDDVVGGSNGFCGNDYLCTAKAGYDAPTGLGTPRGTGAL